MQSAIRKRPEEIIEYAASKAIGYNTNAMSDKEEVEPPVWAKWIAMDSDGFKSFHEEIPTTNLGRWVSSKRNCLVDGVIYDSSNWENSLQSIQR